MKLELNKFKLKQVLLSAFVLLISFGAAATATFAWFTVNRNANIGNSNISIDESVGYDKDGNEITFMDILKTPKPDFAEDIHLKNNIELYNLLKAKLVTITRGENGAIFIYNSKEYKFNLKDNGNVIDCITNLCFSYL